MSLTRLIGRGIKKFRWVLAAGTIATALSLSACNRDQPEVPFIPLEDLINEPVANTCEKEEDDSDPRSCYTQLWWPNRFGRLIRDNGNIFMRFDFAAHSDFPIPIYIHVEKGVPHPDAAAKYLSHEIISGALLSQEKAGGILTPPWEGYDITLFKNFRTARWDRGVGAVTFNDGTMAFRADTMLVSSQKYFWDVWDESNPEHQTSTNWIVAHEMSHVSLRGSALDSGEATRNQHYIYEGIARQIETMLRRSPQRYSYSTALPELRSEFRRIDITTDESLVSLLVSFSDDIFRVRLNDRDIEFYEGKICHRIVLDDGLPSIFDDGLLCYLSEALGEIPASSIIIASPPFKYVTMDCEDDSYRYAQTYYLGHGVEIPGSDMFDVQQEISGSFDEAGLYERGACLIQQILQTPDDYRRVGDRLRALAQEIAQSRSCTVKNPSYLVDFAGLVEEALGIPSEIVQEYSVQFKWNDCG
ncbi:hypothetical protein HYX12_02035, partial [Candidatus Woesearchaeota archaeon]|nr:hypothetical protein [Candidatus Woesearchaeota archaeon]